jgi:hypothetical protein
MGLKEIKEKIKGPSIFFAKIIVTLLLVAMVVTLLATWITFLLKSFSTP